MCRGKSIFTQLLEGGHNCIQIDSPLFWNNSGNKNCVLCIKLFLITTIYRNIFFTWSLMAFSDLQKDWEWLNVSPLLTLIWSNSVIKSSPVGLFSRLSASTDPFFINFPSGQTASPAVPWDLSRWGWGLIDQHCLSWFRPPCLTWVARQVLAMNSFQIKIGALHGDKCFHKEGFPGTERHRGFSGIDRKVVRKHLAAQPFSWPSLPLLLWEAAVLLNLDACSLGSVI